VAKGLLAEQGIESIISADDCGGYRPQMVFGTGGVQLIVKKDDTDKAIKILENK